MPSSEPTIQTLSVVENDVLLVVDDSLGNERLGSRILQRNTSVFFVQLDRGFMFV